MRPPKLKTFTLQKALKKTGKPQEKKILSGKGLVYIKNVCSSKIKATNYSVKMGK